MRITRYGLELLKLPCPIRTCGAEPGQLCGPNNGGAIPHLSEKRWPHGVHYARETGYTAPFPAGTTKAHDDIPRVDLPDDEYRALLVTDKLRRAT